jgi:hypothetical protein
VIIKEAEVKAAKIVEQANSDLARLNNELMRLISRKESLIGRLRVLLSSELELLKTLDLGGGDSLGSGSSHGTGKESMEIDSILKNLDNDRTP